jgi:hypothetical protein
MITQRPTRSPRLLCAIVAMTFASLTLPAMATGGAVDPSLEKQEQEVERLLKNAEAEFWSLKLKIERDRAERAQRVAAAKAEYERAQQTAESTERNAGASESELAAYKADEALERYQAELELAITGVDSARDALGAIESRVSRYRAALDALRRKARNPAQSPNARPATPDTSSTRAPVTVRLGSEHARKS